MLKKAFYRIKVFLLKLVFHNLHCHKSTIIDGHIEIKRNGEVFIGGKTIIKRWVVLRPYGGSIKIGENCSINSFCHISGNGGVTIGNNVLIATHCVIVSANHAFEDPAILIRQQGETAKPIVIEDDCWLGAGVTVLSGVTIHTGAVIGAGAVVTHDIPAYSVAVGVPARVIRNRQDVL